MVADLDTVGVVRVPCVGAIVRDDNGRLLVVERRYAPAAGTWSLPGGRVEAGESPADAVRREVLEETGIRVDVDDVVGVVELAGTKDRRYVVTDYAARVANGTTPHPTAGDDAAAARWVTQEEFAELDTSPGLAETLVAWHIWS